MFDYLIVGAGFGGSVVAERLASQAGKTVLVVDKRPHVGGNAYDYVNEDGLLVHKYGPHIFHTNSEAVFEYLSQFTEWRPYEHRVLASVDDQLLPIPINLDTINRLYGLELESDDLERFFAERAEPVASVRTSEDVIVSKIGRDLYEKFFQGYTRKQWGLDPSELDASVTARIPVRTDRDDRYFTDEYQAMPIHGYTRMFERMLDHPLITIRLGTDYLDADHLGQYREVIYTGPIDAFFDYQFGRLPYRSLEFRHETLPVETYQPTATVNYPNEHPYTRITEFKYLTGQQSDCTSIVYEYPKAEGDPYYPVPRPENAELYRKYQELAEATPGVHFVGRLATYKYYNMDQVVAQALTLCKKLVGGRTDERAESQLLDVWAGVECTVNRVGDQYFDQLKLTGHDKRPSDLDLIAGLGVQAVRYPVVWERVAPDRLEEADWSWTDERLNRLRELGIEPIVTLVHHGSGPRHTNLLDPAWPEKLSAFARAVAQRYPWLRMYTPVNEPLTTARFSALYGFWYPHRKDTESFVRATVNQCRGVVLAMQAIRETNPDAELIQTEDVGTTYSTGPLAYQAEYQNMRRWLSMDLLCGMVDPEHPWWPALLDVGVTERELFWFMEEAHPPDCLGVNHYLSSDRFLDHRLELYPEHLHGGNGRDAYVDVEALRLDLPVKPGPYVALSETWRRYGIPIAVTEAHNGCTREEQIRWLVDVYNAARRARSEGASVRAFTAWSAFGCVDWNTMVTESHGFYEPGLFDVRGPEPRPTAAAVVVAQLAAGEKPNHPVLRSPGWWGRPERVLYPLSR